MFAFFFARSQRCGHTTQRVDSNDSCSALYPFVSGFEGGNIDVVCGCSGSPSPTPPSPVPSPISPRTPAPVAQPLPQPTAEPTSISAPSPVRKHSYYSETTSPPKSRQEPQASIPVTSPVRDRVLNNIVSQSYNEDLRASYISHACRPWSIHYPRYTKHRMIWVGYGGHLGVGCKGVFRNLEPTIITHGKTDLRQA